MPIATKFSSQTTNTQLLLNTTQGSVGSKTESAKTETSFLDLLKSIDLSKSKTTDGSNSADTQLKNDRPVEPQKNDSSQKVSDSTHIEKPVEKDAEKKDVKEKKTEEKKSEKKDSRLSEEDKIDAAQKVQASQQKILAQIDKRVAKNGPQKEATASIEAEQLSYLKTAEDSGSLDALIDNASTYTQKRTKKELLDTAQSLSLEDPKQFLDTAEIAGENKNAAGINRKTLSKMTAQNEEGESAATKKTTKTVKKESKDVFTVVDERGSASKEEAVKEQKGKLNVTLSSQESNAVDMTVTLSNNAQQNILSTNNQTAGASGSNFQAMLSEQIQQNAPDFVKAGNIVLRDNSNGSINMVLKPESLGNVKINLQLSDKVITGQITVASQEAYDAFKENIDTLKQAFQQSGFESATFNLSFANNSNAGTQGQQQQQMNNSWLADRAYGDYAVSGDNSVSSESATSYKKDSHYTIDYVA